MTERASLVVTRKRGPPRHRSGAPDQPSQTEISLSNPIEELAMAIAELQELDHTMTQTDQTITQIETKLADSSTDEWDAIELEPKRDALLEQRIHQSCSVLYAANRVTHLGAWLIGEWRETELDNMARQLSQTDGMFARVATEWPHVLEDPVWQRVYQEACPI